MSHNTRIKLEQKKTLTETLSSLAALLSCLLFSPLSRRARASSDGATSQPSRARAGARGGCGGAPARQRARQSDRLGWTSRRRRRHPRRPARSRQAARALRALVRGEEEVDGRNRHVCAAGRHAG
eukprot:scaffold175747_cov31-Tisochrysis_lutea.AAC.3